MFAFDQSMETNASGVLQCRANVLICFPSRNSGAAFFKKKRKKKRDNRSAAPVISDPRQRTQKENSQ